MYIQKYLILFILTFFTQNLFAQENIWKIGMPVCLSGACILDGDTAIKGAQFAIEDLNEKGGVLGRKVKIIAEDTAESISGAKAVSAFKKLRLDPEIKYFIGPSWSPGGMSIAPLVKDVLITSSSLGVSEFNTASNLIFNSRGVDERGSRKLAQFAVGKNLKKAAVLSSQHAWSYAQGRFFKEEFNKLYGQVNILYEPLPTETNVRTEVLKAVRSKAEVVFISGYLLSDLYLRELYSIGYKGLILFPYFDQTVI